MMKRRFDWRVFVNGLFKLILLMAFYMAGYLSAGRINLEQFSQIIFLKQETIRQQHEIDQFKESNDLINKLEQQVNELTNAVDTLQTLHKHEENETK